MKNILYLLTLVLFVSSCSTAYKAAQTPDDLYYSPVPEVSSSKKVEKDDYYVSTEERQIRMRAYDYRWRYIDDRYDYDYRYNPYAYGYNYGYYYNPFYYNYPVYFPGVLVSNPKNNTPRMTNLGSYMNTSTKVVDVKTGKVNTYSTYRKYNTSNSDLETRRPVYNNNNSYNNNSSQGNNRSYSPSSSSSSGGGTPFIRNSRGN